METSCSPDRGRLVVNSCRARYAPRPKEILSRRKPGYQTGRRCLTCWRKSPWAAVNDKGRNVAGGHSSGSVCRAAREIPHDIWVQSSPGAWVTSGFREWLLLICCSFSWSFDLSGKSSKESAWTRHKMKAGEEDIVVQYSVYCWVCTRNVGAARRKPLTLPESARNSIQRRQYLILTVWMNEEMFLKISQMRKVKPSQRKQYVRGQRDFLIQKRRKGQWGG